MEIDISESLNFSFCKGLGGNMTLNIGCADSGLISMNISYEELYELKKTVLKMIEMSNTPVDNGLVGDLY